MNLFETFAPDQHSRSDGGFTLVEALVATAVLGILTVVLANVITQVSEAAISQRATGKMMTNLNIAGNQLVQDLRAVARNNEITPDSFRFIGRDGDGTFERSTITPHDDLSVAASGDVDHMHMHTLYSDEDLRSNSDMASERVRMCYFLCVQAGGCEKDEAGGEDAILKRRDTHLHEDVDESNKPVPDLTEDLAGDLLGVEPFAFNTDYMSFRYYDNESESWSNTWDSDSEEGDLPDAVEFAFRGYDPAGNVPPQWYIGMVSLNSK